METNMFTRRTGVARLVSAFAAIASGSWRRSGASAETLVVSNNETESWPPTALREIDRDEWRHKLARDGIDETLAAQLADYVRPNIALVPHSATTLDKSAVGCSRLGGRPDLPSGMKWPVREPYNLVYPRGNRSAMNEDRSLFWRRSIWLILRRPVAQTLVCPVREF
jgi:hypothetical protein